MNNIIDEYLFEAIKQENPQFIIHLLGQGANPYSLLEHGRTCIMEAVRFRNTSILKLLLEKEVCSFCSPNSATPNNSFKKSKSQKRKHDTLSETNASFARVPSKHFQVTKYEETNRSEHRNRGYYVFIHDDDESSTEESNCNFQRASFVSPPPSDLEWDEEVGTASTFPTKEDDTWSSMYKWYAEILERTGSVLSSNNKFSLDQPDMDRKKTALHHAVDCENAEAIKILINAGCKVDLLDLDGLTPLHNAILNGFLEGMNILLRAGSRINQLTHRKTSSMHLAAYSKNILVVKRVAEAGGRIDERDNFDRTPLNVAARKGCVDIISYLLGLGAAINSENHRGSTPLCEAVFRNHTHVVDLLLTSGARVTHSHKLLHYAVFRRNVVLVDLLVRHAKGGINLYDDHGNTALHKATRFGLKKIATILLEHGADIKVYNKLTGEHVLHVAAYYLPHAALFEDFLLLFMKYNVDINSMGNTNVTALRKALLRENYEAAAILIKHGARPPAPSGDRPPLPATTRRLLHVAGGRGGCGGRGAPSLAQLARLRVRDLAGPTPVCRFIESLPLPPLIKRYVMFEPEIEAIILNSNKKQFRFSPDNELPPSGGSSSDSA